MLQSDATVILYVQCGLSNRRWSYLSMNGEHGPPCLTCTPPTKAASKNVDVRLGSYQNINAEYDAVGKS